MPCGSNCTVVEHVVIALEPGVQKNPKGGTRETAPTDEKIKTTLEELFKAAMAAACAGERDAKVKCECKKKPGAAAVNIDRTGAAEPATEFTVNIPPVEHPERTPHYEVIGKYKVKYDATPGMCEPGKLT